jgi:hypothetical protein
MPKYCPACKLPLQHENARVCPHCEVVFESVVTPEEPKKIRSSFLAVLLSFFFVGWGQWYNGKTFGGLKYFGTFWIFYLLLLVSSYLASIQPSIGIVVLIFLILMTGSWVFGMYDAYETASRINHGKDDFIGKSDLFWFPVCMIILIMFAVITAFIFGITDWISQFFILHQRLLTTRFIL